MIEVAIIAGGPSAERGISLKSAKTIAKHLASDKYVSTTIDAMPDGGVLELQTRQESGAVVVTVEDDGAGIAPGDLPHIFEAFYSTKPEVRGIGLGLFVSEGIVRGHRGRLTVDSEAGRGSRFTIELPRETLDSALAHEHDQPSGAAAGV